MITVTVANIKFDVEIDGNIRQPHRVSQFMLDEVRLAASSEYLGMRRKLTKDEHFYWQAVSQKTNLLNFKDGQKGRRR